MDQKVLNVKCENDSAALEGFKPWLSQPYLTCRFKNDKNICRIRFLFQGNNGINPANTLVEPGGILVIMELEMIGSSFPQGDLRTDCPVLLLRHAAREGGPPARPRFSPRPVRPRRPGLRSEDPRQSRHARGEYGGPRGGPDRRHTPLQIRRRPAGLSDHSNPVVKSHSVDVEASNEQIKVSSLCFSSEHSQVYVSVLPAESDPGAHR